MLPRLMLQQVHATPRHLACIFLKYILKIYS
jgi:hypothetical protein